MGPTRSVRLPAAIDAWYEERRGRYPERSPSEVLVALVHGGLRLREGYMAIHRHRLEERARSNASDYATYLACLRDTFGSEYVDHLERWLVADHVGLPSTAIES